MVGIRSRDKFISLVSNGHMNGEKVPLFAVI